MSNSEQDVIDICIEAPLANFILQRDLAYTLSVVDGFGTASKAMFNLAIDTELQCLNVCRFAFGFHLLPNQWLNQHLYKHIVPTCDYHE